MEDVLAVYEQAPQPNRARLYFDERTCQLIDELVAPLTIKPGKVGKEDNEYVRKGTCVVLLAYDLDTGQRYVQVRKRRTKADYAEFMHELVSAHYPDIDLVEVVQDNLNTHKYGSFYEHLAVERARALSRQVIFHYTPKHGSWQSRVAGAIEFPALARQCLNRRIGSLDELDRQISLWVSERNQRAVKVHWSFTVATAESKLKRWYEQVNPANKLN